MAKITYGIPNNIVYHCAQELSVGVVKNAVVNEKYSKMNIICGKKATLDKEGRTL